MEERGEEERKGEEKGEEEREGKETTRLCKKLSNFSNIVFEK